MTKKTTHAIVIAVLESYEYVTRQLLWFNGFMGKYPNWEVIFVDDGSEPEIPEPDFKLNFKFKLLRTHDGRPWTQPGARNFGANHTAADYILFTDIDHVITEEAVQASERFTGDKLHFERKRAVLDSAGIIRRDLKTLKDHGCPDSEIEKLDEHFNTFCIKHSVFNLLGGYDEKFCGKYGGDDTDFSDRYGKLHRQGKCARSVTRAALIWVAPAAKDDKGELFHGIRRKIKAERDKKDRQRRAAIEAERQKKV